MINLLPKSEKERLLKEKRKRLALIVNFLILLSLLSFLLSLISVKITISGEVNSLRIIVENTEKNLSNLKEIEKEIQEGNKNILKLKKSLEKKVYFCDILGEISTLLPEKIYLKNVSFNRTFESKKKKYYYLVSLSGVSEDRISLFEFKKNLEKNFQDLNFPPSNWIVPENIEFRLSFQIWPND